MNEQTPNTPRVRSAAAHRQVSRRRFLRLVLATSGGLAGLAAVSCGPSAPAPATQAPAAAIPTPAPWLMTTPTSAPAPTAAPTRAAQPTAAPAATVAPTVAPTTAPAATAETKPVVGGKVIAAVKSEFSGLDPALNSDYLTWSMQKAVYNGLYNVSPKLEIFPELAESMPQISDGGTRYTIKLRKGVKFHNGREMTADDVVFSFTRVVDPKTRSWGPSHLSSIVGWDELRNEKAATLSGVKAVDPYTFEIRLKQPLGYFLHVLTHAAPHVVPKDVAERLGGKMTEAVGTGAFKVKEWLPGQRLVLVKNKDWFFGPRPYLDEVEYQIGVDPQVQLLRVLKGELDYAVDPPPAVELASIINDPKYKDYRLIEPMTQGVGLGINVQIEPFTKLEVRQAAAHALNRTKYVEALGGAAFPSNSYVPAGIPGFNKDLKPIPYDPAKSKELLQKAGVGGDIKAELWLTIGISHLETVMPMVQQDLKQVGIDVELRRVATGAFNTAVRKNPGVAMFQSSKGPNYPEVADWYMYPFGCANVADGGTNGFKYCNPKLDELRTEADKLYRPEDQPKRLQMYQELEREWLAASAYIPLYQINLVRLRAPRFKGMFLHPLWWEDWESVWTLPK
ncbi:MAG: ABC transporter substrate-binding protein [Chloroflexi bacterium]|nr:ABC transporter substrate-binding protein [Chloroflexota bacterium]